ncbi:hypothetical protein DL98DRAFT_581791 [Cadophora sp. DSE1049]|nr:hypothetical protein DL98DRAFT_581791 [Cadophora sp. DSE1049]
MALPQSINSTSFPLGSSGAQAPKPEPTSTNFTTLNFRPINPKPQPTGDDHQIKMPAHESDKLLRPYYPSRNLGLLQRPLSSSRFPNGAFQTSITTLSSRCQIQTIDSLADFLSPPIPRNRSKKPLLPPSRYLKVLADPLPLAFLRLLLEIRREIYDYFDAASSRAVQVSLVSDYPHSSPNFKLYFKAINTRVPKLLHISKETRDYGLEKYKVAFTNYYDDGSTRLAQSADGEEWVVEEGADLDDGWGYEMRYNAYLVVVPKATKTREQGGWWEKMIETREMESERKYECKIVGPVVLPPRVVRDVVPLPGECGGYLRSLVRALESDPLVLRRPLGESQYRFWE